MRQPLEIIAHCSLLNLVSLYRKLLFVVYSLGLKGTGHGGIWWIYVVCDSGPVADSCDHTDELSVCQRRGILEISQKLLAS